MRERFADDNPLRTWAPARSRVLAFENSPGRNSEALGGHLQRKHLDAWINDPPSWAWDEMGQKWPLNSTPIGGSDRLYPLKTPDVTDGAETTARTWILSLQTRTAERSVLIQSRLRCRHYAGDRNYRTARVCTLWALPRIATPGLGRTVAGSVRAIGSLICAGDGRCTLMRYVGKMTKPRGGGRNFSRILEPNACYQV